MNRRLLIFLARVANNEPRALARLDRLQVYAAGVLGSIAGLALGYVALAACAALALDIQGVWR